MIIALLAFGFSSGSKMSIVTQAKAEEKVGVNFAQALYSYHNISIEYPQLVGLTDKELESKINERIKTAAIQNISGKKKDKVVYQNITFDVKLLSANLLSVAFKGARCENQMEFPTEIFYTLNISLIDGDLVRLKDHYNLNKSFLEAFLYKDYGSSSDKDSALSYLRSQSDKELFLMLDKKSPNVYFTKDGVGVSFSLPHVLGDHVELELSYEDLLNSQKL
jgi:hypothetical protein